MADHETLPPNVHRRLTEATALLAEAEKELETVMREIVSAERADKTIITEVVQSAFRKLATARTNLEEVLRDQA
jgi:hypothetical protein